LTETTGVISLRSGAARDGDSAGAGFEQSENVKTPRKSSPATEMRRAPRLDMLSPLSTPQRLENRTRIEEEAALSGAAGP